MSPNDNARLDPLARQLLLDEALLAYLEAIQSGPVDVPAFLRVTPRWLRNWLIISLSRIGMTPYWSRPLRDTPHSPELPSDESEFLNSGLHPFGKKYAGFGLINRGGMGTIYRCQDTQLGRSLAMKVMHPHLALNTEFVRDFHEEAQVAAQLIHPNIAPIHERGMLLDGRPYFTMKLVEGRILTEFIREYHKTPTTECFDALLRYFVGVCNALAYAHLRNVLHRDLKPENVMIGAFGEVQVMDWGLSKVVVDGCSRFSEV